MRKLDAAWRENLEKLILSMGCELYGVEVVPQGRQQVLRIYIDSADKETKKGVTIDDCSRVSYQVGAMLDVEDTMKDRYLLEVSSPGIDRPLFELKHYQQHVGGQVKMKLHSPIEGRRQYKGILQRIDGEQIVLIVDGDVSIPELAVPFSAIEKASVVGDTKL